jgi:hypothetical protein
MTDDPMSKLHATIAATARDRDLKEKQSRDEQAAKERQRSEAGTIWAARKKELPEIVKDVDAMLKQYGFAGIAPVVVDLKHSDIDRAVINFEHSSHNHSKIMLRSTRSGEFICSIAAVSGDVYSSTMPIGELTADKLKEAVAKAVSECLTAAWAPRSERPQKPVEAPQ